MKAQLYLLTVQVILAYHLFIGSQNRVGGFVRQIMLLTQLGQLLGFQECGPSLSVEGTPEQQPPWTKWTRLVSAPLHDNESQSTVINEVKLKKYFITRITLKSFQKRSVIFLQNKKNYISSVRK